MKNPAGLTIKFTDDIVGELATLDVSYPPNHSPILMVMRDGKLQGAEAIDLVRGLLTNVLAQLNAAVCMPVRTESNGTTS